MRNLKLIAFLTLQSVLLLQAGCSHFEPGEIYEDDMSDRSGLFSGEKGGFDVSV